ncbi:MAG TPA: GAF domain-containing protein, partial [Aggregatilineaceae bacterium]|nr:GAF domain-containing protein [Aggregatilineaceae bacterium]
MLITTKTMPTGDMISYFGVGWGIAVLLWIIAVAIFFRRPANSVVHMIAWLIAALAVYLAGSFDAVSTHQLVPAYLLAGHLLGGMLMMFALEFPHRLEWVQKTPGMRFAPLAVAGVLGAIAAIFYYSADPNLYNIAFIMPNAVVVLGGIILGVTMFVLRERSSSPIARNQRTIVVMGLVPWLLFLLGGTIQLFMDEPWVNLTVFNQVLPLLLPLSLIYASSQLRLVDTDRVITQSIMYGMLAMLVVAYWLIVTGIAQIFEQLTNNTVLNTPVFIAVSIFLIALFFEPLRVFMQRQIDNFYFRARHNYQKYLQDFAREVTDAASLKNVISLVQSYLGEAINPDHVILFVRNNVTQDFRPEPDPAKGYPLTDITFTAESGLLRYLREQENILHLKQGEALPMEVISDGKRLGVLDSRVLVGLKSQNNLIGFLAIGPRQGGGLYVHEDLRFIVSLSDQIGLAVERARVIDDLEHRVRVQDVLSQVSRALNFAIDFDTLLELVYAQTIRVIDAPNFYIALRNPNTDELTYVFYNEGDERVMHMEGHRWRMGRDLISEIARTQQTIRTDDFVRESLLRDPRAQLDNSSLKAWMGVPLLADTGGGVLGVMVASTTEPGKVFTDEQQDLFWDIANLAASALDKLQLFEKTQQRARQLSAINEISSQLAAELGDVDRLLRLITENAV